jgi:acylphosphatase
MSNVCTHVHVTGDVQGVGFRYSAIHQANAIGVTGWVRNLWDGRVEAMIEGEESLVQQMVEWCRQGPRSAEVTDLDVEMLPYTGKFTRFDVRY